MGKFGRRVIKEASCVVDGKTATRKELSMSIVSLVLAFMVLVSTTYCWFAIKRAEGHFNSMNLVTDIGLRSNDLGETLKHIADKSFLHPASSVDGRNLFFPSDGADFSNTTTTITYRSANEGDKNINYLQYDFELMAEANYTSIYIDLDKTNIFFSGWDDENETAEYRESKKTKSKALRTALFYDGMKDNKPILFNSQGKTVENTAIEQVDRTDGSIISTATQRSFAFRDYTYGKTPIAVLNQGDKRRFSLIVWIEGTDENCTDDLIGEKLDVHIGFTTSWDHKDKVTFEDQTSGGTSIKSYLEASNHNGYSLVLIYNDEEHLIENSKFPMYYDSELSAEREYDTWYCYIPDNASHDITFQIVNNQGNKVTDGIVYEWASDMSGKTTVNRLDATRYIADGYVSTSPRGHWYDGDIEDKGYGQDDGGIVDLDDDW